MLRTATIEDALWSDESSTDAVVKKGRDMPFSEFVTMLLDFGLYETLRQEAV